MKIQRALVSVSDKTGLIDFARELVAMEIEIISTGGTASLLKKEGVPSTEISKFTGSPEILDGRVKTLHPKVHGGLLYLRDNPDHIAQAEANGIQPIDLVVVNLYPFEETIAKPDVTLEEAIENIDIGGPSMLRSAAKNYRSVTVVVDPADYADVLQNMRDNDGATTLKMRERLGDQGLRDHLEIRRSHRELSQQGAGDHLLLLAVAPVRRASALRRKPAPAGDALRQL